MASGGEAYITRSERKKGKGIADLVSDAESLRLSRADDDRLSVTR